MKPRERWLWIVVPGIVLGALLFVAVRILPVDPGRSVVPEAVRGLTPAPQQVASETATGEGTGNPATDPQSVAGESGRGAPPGDPTVAESSTGTASPPEVAGSEELGEGADQDPRGIRETGGSGDEEGAGPEDQDSLERWVRLEASDREQEASDRKHEAELEALRTALQDLEGQVGSHRKNVVLFWLLLFFLLLTAVPAAFFLRRFAETSARAQVAALRDRLDELESQRTFSSTSDLGESGEPTGRGDVDATLEGKGLAPRESLSSAAKFFDSSTEDREALRRSGLGAAAVEGAPRQESDSAMASGAESHPGTQPSTMASGTVASGIAADAASKVGAVGSQPRSSMDGLERSLAQVPRGSEVGHSLLELLGEGRVLARMFQDSELVEVWSHELDDRLEARLRRLVELAPQDEETFYRRWIEPDLVTCLDLLGRLLSKARELERAGRADPELGARVEHWLYGSHGLGSACQHEGWIQLDQVLPFETRFNPQMHHSMGTRRIAGHKNVVIKIHEVGRWDLRPGGHFHKARVTVGS